jgi:3-hydroxybutyryl-CoA dehydrogenase
MLAMREVSDREFKDSKYRPAPLLKELVAGGRRGRKSGRGICTYIYTYT